MSSGHLVDITQLPPSPFPTAASISRHFFHHTYSLSSALLGCATRFRCFLLFASLHRPDYHSPHCSAHTTCHHVAAAAGEKECEESGATPPFCRRAGVPSISAGGGGGGAARDTSGRRPP